MYMKYGSCKEVNQLRHILSEESKADIFIKCKTVIYVKGIARSAEPTDAAALQNTLAFFS